MGKSLITTKKKQFRSGGGSRTQKKIKKTKGKVEGARTVRRSVDPICGWGEERRGENKKYMKIRWFHGGD